MDDLNKQINKQIKRTQSQQGYGTSLVPYHTHDNINSPYIAVQPTTAATTGKFGGTGADGNLVQTSGVTTIDLGNATQVIKNYLSISLTGTASVNFINPAPTGTLVNLFSQGNVTLTSSATPIIDCSGMGAAGGAAGVTSPLSGSITAGIAGTTADPIFILDSSSHSGGGGQKDGVYTGGTGGLVLASPTNFYTRGSSYLYRNSIYMLAGSGGGGGGGAQGNSGASGAGGNGGGALIIECGGSFNYTTIGGITVSGAKGVNATAGVSVPAGSSGGGGGAAGSCLILYNSLTANTGTVLCSGGNGGTGATVNAGDSSGGGGGAGGFGGAGGAGGTGTAVAGNGAAGTAGAGAGAGGGGGCASVGVNTGGVGGAGQADPNAITVAINSYFS